MSLKIKVKRLVEDAVIPFKAHPTDSGFDLIAVEDMIIWPFETKKINTGLAFELPSNYELQVRPRSGLSLKTGLKVIFGTVDNSYRGEVGVIAINVSSKEILVNKGDKVAQAVFQKIPDIELVEVQELNSGDRGVNGFGSTGV
ncbi:dUTP diphosphatase [Rummeliibacillus sp. TYF005]|uniref:dUTP diphosphatase n=1 Tax=Rummeliibacillus sp. TYF005 TaxID=2058214 RepID=UPI000F5288AD|nr:dUTP diphosphatase [Rummeliibacillus sp. TYF005]RPJ97271.1 dUTP diphosphatase [Rummeliibacillus sp. TYF005]